MEQGVIPSSEVFDILTECHKLIMAREYDNAMSLIEVVLDDNPNNAPALNFAGYIAMMSHNDTVAYQYLKRAIQQDPSRAPVWSNFGLAAQHLGRHEECLSACMKSVELDPNYALGWTNAASALIAMSRWEEAEICAKKALEINPNEKNSKGNLAHTYLAQHRWEEGWKQWGLSLGGEQRKEWCYGDEQRWDGSKGQAVVIYGEQGLGDEIMFASCIPDAINDCKKVIVDCDPKLEGLFKRSFPKADVYGTRRDSSPDWLANARIDARCSVGSLPEFYRNSEESFPGTPYLKADPDKVLMWKALWAKKGKRVIGICSEGGAKYTNKRGRKIPVEAWESLFKQDAIFVSLDYRDGIVHPNLLMYEVIAKSPDYDDTAALIASLDAVVGVNTTAVHCANALGVKTHVLIPKYYPWRYEGKYVWSKGATLYHQQDRTWAETIKDVTV
jgi:hypothetical protein